MIWTDFLLGSEKIKAIFPEIVPTLTSVNLHEISLHRDGPRVMLRFDLSEYPEVPPQKWQTQGFNRVQIQLMLIDIQDISIKGWTENCQIDLLLRGEGGRVKLIGSNGLVAVEILAGHAQLEKISGYLSVQ